MTEILSAPLVVEFPFTRSLGPVQSAFLTGLRERTVLGVRADDGRVLVPPVEYDPVTANELRSLVRVAPTGTVTTWAWNPAPRRDQPLGTPFAWVLVRLDGADTALLHALDAPGPDAVHTGMRVRIRWAAARTGAITDIACFEPYDGEPGPTEPAPHDGEFTDPVTGITVPARLDYVHTPGRAQSAYLKALEDHRTVGERCPACRKVYVPPRGACPTCGIATAEQVEVGRAAPSPPSASSTSKLLIRQISTSKSPTSTPTSPSTAPTSPSTAASQASRTTRSAWGCASSRSGPRAHATPTTTGPPGSPTPTTTRTRSWCRCETWRSSPSPRARTDGVRTNSPRSTC